MVFRGKNTIICSSDVILNPINEGMPQMVADIKERDFNTSSEYFEGAAEFLRTAKELEYKLLLASNLYKYMIDAYIAENCGVSREIDIRNIFDEIIIPPENATVKDQRDGVLRLAIALSGQEPHKVIAIERTLEGVERAVRLGVDSVAVCDMYDFNQEYIRALATFSENDFYVLIQKLEK